MEARFALLHPAPQHKQLASDKQRAENRFVVAGQPNGQENIKVVRAIVGVPRRHIGERASPSIESKYGTFQKHKQGKRRGPVETMQQCSCRKGKNAQGEEGPDDSVQQLDGEHG